MRKAFLFGVAFAFATCGSLSVAAEEATAPTLANHHQNHQQAEPPHFPVIAKISQSDDGRWLSLKPDAQLMVDKVAADFFEKSLRQAQSSTIELNTAQEYMGLSEAERTAFRKTRLAQWQQMSQAERLRLRNVKTPSFMNLTESQKWPFRLHALDQLNITKEAKNTANGQILASQV